MFHALSARLMLAIALAIGMIGCGDSADEAAPITTDTAAAAAAPASMGSAQYTVVVKSRWTRANHPFEYPSSGALTGPHFSGVIGVAHNDSYSIFREGAPPTPGLESLSETGKHGPLDDEIRAAAASGGAGTLFETGPLRDFGDSLVTTVTVDEKHPLVSLVAMVAPSPDWFTGVSSVNLVENGQWVASRTLEVNAYDSGGDEGATYKAPDKDNNPKKPTKVADTPHFRVNGALVPVATVTFRKN
ncbi:MAG TPA: spondin domain-containing protein [Gemmatimonadaceae bacterium]|nr:spondin domain-containing protein [Gemmatimonadaceae bacterium]